jgi:hypothetical protein
MKIGRKEFLLSLGGVAVGGPLGALAQPHITGANTPKTTGSAIRRYIPVQPPGGEYGARSFSQSGEDVIVDVIFRFKNLGGVSYLDVGAYHPILISNTYYFYLRGCRGVLVEPNGAMCAQLRAVRPDDVTLEAAIGAPATGEADYYVLSEPSLNTFSKEEAERRQRESQGQITIKEVRKMPMLDINAVIDEHFQGAPAFVSIDAEAFSEPILRSIDFTRIRPTVLCVETPIPDGSGPPGPVVNFMAKQGYVVRGGSIINTIFVDGRV